MNHSSTDINVGLYTLPLAYPATALFIFLSGYLTTERENGYADMIRRRIIRVIIPYTIWTLLYCVLYSEKNILRALLLADTPYLMYYIFIYIELTLLIPLMLTMAKSKYRMLFLLISPITVILTRYLPSIVGFEINEQLYRLNGLIWFSFFYIGLMLRNKYIDDKKIKLKYVSYGYLVMLIFAYVEGFVWHRYGLDNMAKTQLKLSAMMLSALACLVAYLFIINFQHDYSSGRWKLIVEIGDCSFGMYLTHMLCMSVWEKILQKYMTFPINWFFTVVTCFLGVYLARRILKGKLSNAIGF